MVKKVPVMNIRYSTKFLFICLLLITLISLFPPQTMFWFIFSWIIWLEVELFFWRYLFSFNLKFHIALFVFIDVWIFMRNIPWLLVCRFTMDWTYEWNHFLRSQVATRRSTNWPKVFPNFPSLFYFSN